MWGSMLNETDEPLSAGGGLSRYAQVCPSDIIRCLPARLVLMRRNFTRLLCHCRMLGHGAIEGAGPVANQEIPASLLANCPWTTGSRAPGRWSEMELQALAAKYRASNT